MPGTYPKFDTLGTYDKYQNDFESISDDEKDIKVSDLDKIKVN